MKKYLVLLMIIILSGCTSDSKNYIEKAMNIDLKNCILKEERDSHGGFLGDGEYFAKIECKEFELTNNFKKLPMSSYLESLMNIEICSSDKCQNAFERYKIPKLKLGYYYFVDRKPSSYDIKTTSNFSLVIYDSAKKIIYYYELDT